ncbi:hypothetical protein D9758_003868 [Tetrapyrgos nigripes]|uniref:Uncharacterized protein n=1 Tax=Tetrapyrgos nigripes TaxID=182062 RepID=A0A8H5GL11_9AGAR|nr:hypothetical protein D9758_003868 [Tetrapyrgos nigripes]
MKISAIVYIHQESQELSQQVYKYMAYYQTVPVATTPIVPIAMGASQSSIPGQLPPFVPPQAPGNNAGAAAPGIGAPGVAPGVNGIGGSRSPNPIANAGTMGTGTGVAAGEPGTMNPGAGVAMSPYPPPEMNNLGVGPPVGPSVGPGAGVGYGSGYGSYGSYPQGYVNSAGYLASGTGIGAAGTGYGAGYAPVGGGVATTGAGNGGGYGTGGYGAAAGYGMAAPQYGAAGQQQPSVVVIKNGRRRHHGHHHHHSRGRPELRRTRSYDSYYD